MKVENNISYDIRGAAFRVHNLFGPGLLESVYEYALAYELIKLGYNVKRQVGIPVLIDGNDINVGFRIDLLVDERVIIEVKSVESLQNVHYKQVLTYLRLTKLRLGLLINFNSATLSTSIKRIIN